MRTELGPDLGAEHLLREAVQYALEVRHRDTLVHDQTLYLMEHRRVRRIRRITAEASARCEYTDRRLLLEQRPDLYRRGLRPQQNIIVDIEGVGPVSGRVVRSCVQCIEVVEYRFYLRSLRERKAHGFEDAGNFFDGDGQRMLRADMKRLARFCHVDLLRLKLRFLCFLL